MIKFARYAGAAAVLAAFASSSFAQETSVDLNILKTKPTVARTPEDVVRPPAVIGGMSGSGSSGTAGSSDTGPGSDESCYEPGCIAKEIEDMITPRGNAN